MNEDVILKNEKMNDKKTIHLYFNSEIGLYVAYGISAFYVTHIINAMASYSEDLQLPVVLMRKKEVSELRLATIKKQHDYHRYYHLELKHVLGLDGYNRWVDSVKWEN